MNSGVMITLTYLINPVRLICQTDLLDSMHAEIRVWFAISDDADCGDHALEL